MQLTALGNGEQFLSASEAVLRMSQALGLVQMGIYTNF